MRSGECLSGSRQAPRCPTGKVPIAPSPCISSWYRVEVNTVHAPNHYGLSDYIADNYGTCALDGCRCIGTDRIWLGRACPHWRPVEASTWGEFTALLTPRPARD